VSDRSLRLLVGAAIDASFTSVMASVVEQTKRARKQIQSEINASTRASVSAERSAAKEIIAVKATEAKTAKQLADEMAKDVASAAKKAAATKISEEKAASREVERIQRADQRERAKRHAENLKIFREEAAAQKKRDKESGGGGSRGYTRGDAIAMRVGSAAMRAGSRLVGSALHGMGVDTTLSGQLQGSVHRESLATDVAVQSYIESGKGPAGSQTLADPKALMADANRVGSATGTKSEDVLGGLEKFVKMTGDLQTARDSMAEIGKIAKANGVDFGDMMEAAANVSISMGEIPNKAEHLQSIMRTVAGQGHLGAVTIKDMADQMGKLTAQANFFKIDARSKATLEAAGVTNETTQNVAIMGAMAQYARAKGGRITAQQATQSSMAFIRDLANPTEVKRMHERGINVYADAGHTKVRDPMQVMLEVFKSAQTKGGINRDFVNKVFPNQQSRAVANALTQDYDAEYKKAAEAGITDETLRHQKAMEGVTDTFQNYLKVSQTAEGVTERFNLAMKTTESQANILNNNLGSLSDEVSKTLLPVVKELAPAFISAGKTIASWVSEVTGHAKETEINQGVNAGIAGVNAYSLAKRANSRSVVDMTTGGTTNEISGITPEQGKEILSGKKALEEEIARKQKVVDEEGEGRRGPIPGLGEHYKNLSEADLLKEEKGDSHAAQYRQDKIQLEQLKDTFEKLNSTVVKLGLNNESQILKVAIVSDQTHVPGAQPLTSGKASPNSSSAGGHSE